MRIVLFKHPPFLGVRSQELLAGWLAEGLRRRGHEVDVRCPSPWLRRLDWPASLAKWAGYVDQYIVFRVAMQARLAADPPDTLYVFCDQALGPWVPAVARRPHVVHCLDLLALRSAEGEFAEHRTALTGRLYQRMIRRGFRRARHFVSISEKSRDDLHRVGGVRAQTSEVVHLGLHHPYAPIDARTAAAALRRAGLDVDETARGLLHVGGGQWYKNPTGVARLYAQHARRALAAGRAPLPLWWVGPEPDATLRSALSALPEGARVHRLSDVDPTTLQALYSRAAALLFPSLEEGFGWPILEAMACGCPVVTTDAAPMTEIAGPLATYVPRLCSGDDADAWAEAGAQALDAVLARSDDERERHAAASRARAATFDAERAIDRYVVVYERVLAIERAPSLQRAMP